MPLVGDNAGTVFPGAIDAAYNASYEPGVGEAIKALEFIEGCVPIEGLAGVLAQTIPDALATSTLTATAGTIFQALIGLRAGQTVTNLSYITAATAASTPTNSWVGLAYPAIPSGSSTTDVTSKVVAVSADGLTGAIAANTLITVALSTPYVVPTTGWYIAFVCVAATTGPTLAAGVTLGTAGRGALEPWLAGPGSTGKTTPVAVGDTLVEMTAASAMPLIYAN
jgi:hypothetical protein